MKLVWDTSSLSHAFEDLTHAIGSAVSYCIGKARCDVKRYLRRRFRSEYDSKELLLTCDENVCLIPEDVERELMRNPQMRDEIEFLAEGKSTEFVKRYGIRGRYAPSIFKPRLRPMRVRTGTFLKVKRVAKRYGIRISDTDMKAIALALDEGATLITADRKMKELAEILGVPVIFTIGEAEKQVIEL